MPLTAFHVEWTKAMLKHENALFLKLKYLVEDCKQHFLPTLLSRLGNHNPCWKGVKREFTNSQIHLIFTTFKCRVEQIRKTRNIIFIVLEKRLVKSFDKNRQQEIFVVIYYRNMLKVQKVTNKLQRYSFKLGQQK